MTITLESIKETLSARGGTIAAGSHFNDHHATCSLCALEVAAMIRFGYLSDDPRALGLPDIRPINDAYRNGARRTAALVPWLIALDGWGDWSAERRKRWADIVVLRTIREILPIALRAAGMEDHAVACEEAKTLDDGRNAAHAADAAYASYTDSVAAAAAAEAAHAAAEAAHAAALHAHAAALAAAHAAAAADTGRDNILDLAVRIQIEAAEETR